MAADSGPYGLSGAVRSKKDQVVTEVAMDGLNGRSYDSSSSFQKSDTTASGGGYTRRNGHQESLSKCPLLLFSFSQTLLSRVLGKHLQELTAAGLWSAEEKDLHIILEMKDVMLALSAFLQWLLGESVILMSDSAYPKKQGGSLTEYLQIS